MTSAPRSSLFALVLATSCSGTDPQPGPSFALSVEPPAGSECIGVTGFELTLAAAGRPVRQQTVLGGAPVLSKDECRLASAISVGGLDPDAPLDIEIRGYDGVRQLLVTGTAHLPSLREPGDARLELGGVGAPGRPVLALNRALLFGGVDVTQVDALDVRSQAGNSSLLYASLGDGERRFFSATEPTTVVLALPPAGDDVVVTLSLAHGGQRSARALVTPDPSGLYLDAAPR